jgi:hypothetical protein
LHWQFVYFDLIMSITYEGHDHFNTTYYGMGDVDDGGIWGGKRYTSSHLATKWHSSKTNTWKQSFTKARVTKLETRAFAFLFALRNTRQWN